MSNWFVTKCCTSCFSVRGLRGRWQAWGWGQRRTRWGVSELIKTSLSGRFWVLTTGQCWQHICVCVNDWVMVFHSICKHPSEKGGKVICYLSCTSHWYATVCSLSCLYLALSHSRHSLLLEKTHVSQSLPALRLSPINKKHVLAVKLHNQKYLTTMGSCCQACEMGGMLQSYLLISSTPWNL